MSQSDQLHVMMRELEVAADFFVHLLKTQRSIPLNAGQIFAFRSALINSLGQHCLNHWFLDEPTRGCAYRCIRIHRTMDPILMDAAANAGIGLRVLRQTLPQQFSMWVDPGEVSYRFGENGSICVLYDAKKSVVNDNNDGACASANVMFEDDNRKDNANNNPGGSFRQDDAGLVSYNSVNLDVMGSCKKSLRQVDNYLDQRGSSNFEQVPPYVSS